MSPSSATMQQRNQVCRRRLAAILAIKQRVAQQFSAAEGAPQLSERESICSLATSLVSTASACAAATDDGEECILCAEWNEQAELLRQALKELPQNGEKSKKQPAVKASRSPSSSSPSLAPVAGASPVSTAAAEVKKPNTPVAAPKAAASTVDAKAAMLLEVRDLIQGLKHEAVNVSKAVHQSDSMLGQRQKALATQVDDTHKAARKATEAEKLAGIDAGIIGEAILRLCGNVAPKVVVDTFVRPLVSSLFQVLWIVAVVLLTLTTGYIIITSPKRSSTSV